MRKSALSSGLFIAMCASMLMACVSSKPQPTSLTAKVDPALLIDPPKLPQPRKSPDGGQTGADALSSQLDLLDVAGQIRAQLIALQKQVRVSEGIATRENSGD